MSLDINVDERVARAAEYFRQGYNCSQAVVMAYADLYGMDESVAAAVSSSFGAGMGRLREVCGSVSGMFMLVGLQYPATDPTDKHSKTANYTVVQDLAERFRREHGSIVCRELLGLTDTPKQCPTPDDRTPQYYAKRPCITCVEDAARIFGEKIGGQQHRA